MSAHTEYRRMFFLPEKIALFYKRTFLLLPNKVPYKRIFYHCYIKYLENRSYNICHFYTPIFVNNFMCHYKRISKIDAYVPESISAYGK